MRPHPALTCVCLPILLACFAVAASARAEVRQWRTADGRARVTAELVGRDAGQVSLRRQDSGKVVRVATAILSEADRAYLASLPGGQHAARMAGFDPSLYRGLMTHQGVPIATASGLTIKGFTTYAERATAIETLWNHLVLPPQAERVEQALEAGSANQMQDASLWGPLGVAEKLYAGFESTHRGDTLRTGDEFARSARMAKAAAQALPRWVATAPALPLKLHLYRRVTLREYNFAQRHFPLKGGDLLPTTIEGVHLRYANETKPPTAAPMSPADAQAFTARSPQRRLHALTTITVQKVTPAGDYNSNAFVRLEQIAFYADADLTQRVHVVRYDQAPATPPAVAVNTAPASEGSGPGHAPGADNPAPAPDARMRELAKQHGLPVREGLPWYDSENVAEQWGARNATRTPWGKLMDLIEITRTPDLLGLSRLDAAPVVLDRTPFYQQANDRLENYAKRFLFHHFDPQTVSRYITLQNYKATMQPRDWRGATQFEREDLQREFINRYRAAIEESGVRLPVRLLYSHRVSLHGYDQRQRGFPLDDKGAFRSIALPSPISVTQRSQHVPVTPFETPWLLPMDAQQARQWVGRRGQGVGRPATAYMAYAVTLDAVPALRGAGADRAPLVATVHRATLYEDPQLAKPLHRFEVHSHGAPALVLDQADTQQTPHATTPADPLLIPGLLAAESPQPFSDDAWRTAYRTVVKTDAERYESVYGYYRDRMRIASANAYNAQRGRPLVEYVNTAPHPLLSDPAAPRWLFPPGSEPLQDQPQQWSPAFRQRLAGHLSRHAKQAKSLNLWVRVDVAHGAPKLGWNHDSAAAAQLANQSGARAVLQWDAALTKDNRAAGAQLYPSAAGHTRRVALALSLNGRDILHQLSAEEHAQLTREQTESWAEISVTLVGAELAAGNSSAELLAIRGRPARVVIHQVDHAAPLGQQATRSQRRGVVADRQLANTHAPPVQKLAKRQPVQVGPTPQELQEKQKRQTALAIQQSVVKRRAQASRWASVTGTANADQQAAPRRVTQPPVAQRAVAQRTAAQSSGTQPSVPLAPAFGADALQAPPAALPHVQPPRVGVVGWVLGAVLWAFWLTLRLTVLTLVAAGLWATRTHWLPALRGVTTRIQDARGNS